MSEPSIPNDLCLGRYRLDDILRIFEGNGQWFLSNLTWHTKLPATWLADFLAHLHAAGMAKPDVANGEIDYTEPLSITRENLREPLTREKVATLLTRICAKAEEMNADTDSTYTVRRIYLYGSCLRDAESPRDINLGVEIHRDGAPVRKPVRILSVRPPNSGPPPVRSPYENPD